MRAVPDWLPVHVGLAGSTAHLALHRCKMHTTYTAYYSTDLCVTQMTYTVSSGTLNPTQLQLPQL